MKILYANDLHASGPFPAHYSKEDIPDWLDDAMNPDRSSDEDHPTFESYQWGNEDERTFEIHSK